MAHSVELIDEFQPGYSTYKVTHDGETVEVVAAAGMELVDDESAAAWAARTVEAHRGNEAFAEHLAATEEPAPAPKATTKPKKG